jgi:hypothetical protein
MTQPTPPTDGVPPYGQPVAGPDGGWTATPAPSWSPVWTPPAPVPAPGGAPAGQQSSRSLLVLGAVALGGVFAGAVGAAFLVTAVFVGSAGDIGREIGAEVGPEIGRATADALADAMEDSAGAYLEEGLAWGPGGAFAGPVEQFEPVEPGELGPDPVLDEYAADCFAGTLQACDDLLYESAPLSEYEEYALTCGGRVKQFMVAACTDLE